MNTFIYKVKKKTHRYKNRFKINQKIKVMTMSAKIKAFLNMELIGIEYTDGSKVACHPKWITVV